MPPPIFPILCHPSIHYPSHIRQLLQPLPPSLSSDAASTSFKSQIRVDRLEINKNGTGWEERTRLSFNSLAGELELINHRLLQVGFGSPSTNVSRRMCFLGRISQTERSTTGSCTMYSRMRETRTNISPVTPRRGFGKVPSTRRPRVLSSRRGSRGGRFLPMVFFFVTRLNLSLVAPDPAPYPSNYNPTPG